MQIHNERSTGKSATCDERNDLLSFRMAMLGLDLHAIGWRHPETLDKMKRHCTSCSLREACTLDLKRDPDSPAWQSYCPNLRVLNALVVRTKLAQL
jgi:hypothetical protein